MADKIRPLPPGKISARLLQLADLQAGNADGTATKTEVQALLSRQAEAKTLDAGGCHEVEDLLLRDANRSEAQKIVDAGVSSSQGAATLDPELRELPAPLRKLALEIDALWGNSDGKIGIDELDRVARYYLAALPFFAPDAKALLELADRLGYTETGGLAPSRSVIDLRAALASVDRGAVERGRDFREAYNEAIRCSDLPGAPERIRRAFAHSPRWHSLSILEHTAVAVDAASTLCQEPALRPTLSRLGVDRMDLAATMLLHDVGKLIDRRIVDTSGNPEERAYAFWNHEEIGAEWLRRHRIDPAIADRVEHHTDIRNYESAEDFWERQAERDPRKLAELIVVYVADQVAKGTKPAQLASFAEEAPKIRALCAKAGLDADALFAARRALVKRWFDADIS